jgi:hypothetical protein
VIEQHRLSQYLAFGTWCSEVGAYPKFSIGLSRNYFRFVANPDVFPIFELCPSYRSTARIPCI